MAIFNGGDGNDSILRSGLSAGVTTDPPGVAGTQTGEPNLIYGNGGDDVIEAGEPVDGDYYAGGDEIYGGAGRDTIYGSAGYDYLSGDEGDDVIWGGAAGYADFYDGGDGNDVIHAGDNEYNAIVGGTGADTMHGGRYEDAFYVDDAGDRVIEGVGGGRDTIYADIATLVLPENVEDLQFEPVVWSKAIRATGNRIGNVIATGDAGDIVHGRGGDDYLLAQGGADKVYGDGGNDSLFGSSGRDTLYGGAGSDELHGGYDVDLLCGGKGRDVFAFDSLTDSTPTRRDVIGASDGVAFEGAGRTAGDRIDLRGIDADQTDDDYTGFVFGGTGKGHLSVVDSGRNSLVRGNVDDDAGFEFQLLIQDGSVKASAYTAADFLFEYA